MEPHLAKVLFDFDTDEPGEINLLAGEFITVLDRTDEGGWWVGCKMNGEEGEFPFNYVEIIVEEEDEEQEEQPLLTPRPQVPKTTTRSSSSSPRHLKQPSNSVIAHVPDNNGHGGPRSIAVSFATPAGIKKIDIVSCALQQEQQSNVKYTVYNVRVHMLNGDLRITSKRYREFRALQHALKTTFPVVGHQLRHTLQSKMQDRLQHFRRFNDDVIEKRKVALELYLNDLANMASVSALLMAWLFQEKVQVNVAKRTTVLGGGISTIGSPRIGSNSGNGTSKRNGGGRQDESRIGRGIAIADWTGTDKTDMDLWQGDTYTIYKYHATTNTTNNDGGSGSGSGSDSNRYVEISDSSGRRGLAPKKYFKMINVPGSGIHGGGNRKGGGGPHETSRNSVEVRQEMDEEEQLKNNRQINVGGVEKFQLESCEAFDQLMNEGYAVEKNTNQTQDVVNGAEQTTPKTGDSVVVDLVGMLWDASQTFVNQFVTGSELMGQQTDEENTHKNRCTLVLGQQTMTHGLDLAITSLFIGESAMCVVTPPLAFGEVGEPKWGVPASVHVVFDVTLIAVEPSAVVAEPQPEGEGDEEEGSTAEKREAGPSHSHSMDQVDQVDQVDRPPSLSRKPSRRRNRINNNHTSNTSNTSNHSSNGSNRSSNGSNISRNKLYSFAGQKGRKGRMVLTTEEEQNQSTPHKQQEQQDREEDLHIVQRMKEKEEQEEVQTVDLSTLSTEELMKKASAIMGLQNNSSGNVSRQLPPVPTTTTSTTSSTTSSSTTTTTTTTKKQPDRKQPPPAPAGRSKSPSIPNTTTLPSASSTTCCIPYEKLIGMNDMDYAKLNIDRTQLETYLSPNEFINALGVTPTEFNALPGWKKKNLKRKKKLF